MLQKLFLGPGACATEMVAFIGYSIYNGYIIAVDIISDSSWDRLTGQHGLVFALTIGAITLWISSQNKDNKEDKRRALQEEMTEKRHRETLERQDAMMEKFSELVVQVTKSQMESVRVSESLTKEITELRSDLNSQSRACVAMQQRRKNLKTIVEDKNHDQQDI